MRKPSHRRGFTLVELLLVVVIIGILAAIAIPKFSSARDKAYLGSITTDLKNLASQQELYHASFWVYANNVAAINNMVVSDGVNISVTQSDGRGWAATAFHDAVPTRQCGIFYGVASAANAVPASVPGVIACQP